jgi:hypothetical protein
LSPRIGEGAKRNHQNHSLVEERCQSIFHVIHVLDLFVPHKFLRP